MKIAPIDALDVYIETNCITFSDEYGSKYSINCETNDDKISVNVNDLVDGLEYMGINTHF